MAKQKLSYITCSLCGREFYGKGYKCPSCYAYLREHPEGLYPQPKYGEVLYATNGDPVCHLCRKAFRKLGNHIQFFHKMSQNEYREKFGLHHNTRLSNEEYVEKMRDYTLDYYDVVIKENLIESGKATRISITNNLPGRKIGNNRIQKTQYSKES